MRKRDVLLIPFIGMKKLFWNRLTKWLLKKLLYLPFKLAGFLGLQVYAWKTWID